MNKPIKIRLHVLSPINIGCDDVYEPTSFVIDEQKKKLIEFDPIDFIKALKPQEINEFTKTASGDNLLAIFKAINRFYKPNIKGREVNVTNALVKHYKKILSMGTFDKKAVINQFTINKTAYNSQSNSPYIPGSSVKGAIRTAYLSALAREKNITAYKGNARDLEKNLLGGSFETDPFRMLKISDLLHVRDISTKIVYAVNKKKKKSDKESFADKGGVYQIFETIQAGAVFEGIININKPENSANIKLPITPDILKSTNKFYIPLLKDEEKMLKQINVSVSSIDNAIDNKFKEQINNKTAFLIRLGRHSGAEAVTIEGNRNIKIMQGKNKQPKYLDHATTLWLASDEPKPTNNNSLLPFNWAVMEVIP